MEKVFEKVAMAWFIVLFLFFGGMLFLTFVACPIALGIEAAKHMLAAGTGLGLAIPSGISVTMLVLVSIILFFYFNPPDAEC